MKRKFYQKLVAWKENNLSTPLMVVGARQIGKTYLIDEFCKNNFEDYIYINLDKSENIQKIFDNTINPEEILSQLELVLNKAIDIENYITNKEEMYDNNISRMSLNISRTISTTFESALNFVFEKLEKAMNRK